MDDDYDLERQALAAMKLAVETDGGAERQRRLRLPFFAGAGAHPCHRRFKRKRHQGRRWAETWD